MAFQASAFQNNAFQINTTAPPSTPDYVVEIAFDTDPGDIPTWTDVSAYVKSFATDRGAQHELDRMQTGTAQLVLDNRDGRFDPTNASGPYYPNVLPLRRLRIRASWNLDYDVFHGFVEGWPQSYPDDGASATVKIGAADGFKMLALARVTGSFVQQASGARITAILDAAGWPASDRDIDTGQSTIAAIDLEDASALEHLLSVAESELGLLYVSRDGILRFVDRQSVFTAPEDYANLTWGDISGEFRYEDLVLDFDDSHIWNDVRVTREGGVEQVATDTPSQDRYFRRTFTRSVVLANDNEVLDHAGYLLLRFREPELRASSLDAAAMLDSAQWPRLLGLDIGDRLRVRRRPISGGTIEKDVYLQGIEHDHPTYDRWGVTFRLAPVGAGNDFWELDVSLLDSTTRLGV